MTAQAPALHAAAPAPIGVLRTDGAIAAPRRHRATALTGGIRRHQPIAVSIGRPQRRPARRPANRARRRCALALAALAHCRRVAVSSRLPSARTGAVIGGSSPGRATPMHAIQARQQGPSQGASPGQQQAVAALTSSAASPEAVPE
jgi:hypothetical protein